MTSDSDKSENLILGAIYVTLCYLCLAIFSACAKVATEIVSPFTVLFYQNVLCLLFVLPKALKDGIWTKKFSLHMFRDLFGFSSYFLLVLSVGSIPLANAVLLSNSAPLWIPFIIWIWFKKKVPRYLWGSIVVGFVGLIFVLKPDKNIADIASVYALLSGVFIGVSMVAIRELTKTEPRSRILFYYFLLGTLISFPFALKELALSITTPVIWFLLASAGFFYLVQIFVTLGFKKGKASTLSPIAYTVVLFSAVLDRIFWHIIPDIWSFIGMVLIILGGISSVYFEKKYESKYI